MWLPDHRPCGRWPLSCQFDDPSQTEASQSRQSELRVDGATPYRTSVDSTASRDDRHKRILGQTAQSGLPGGVRIAHAQIRLQLRLDCPGVAKWVSPRVSAALMSTVLGPTVEFAFIAGNVVTTRSAAVPGAVGLVLMAALGALLVDGPHRLLDRTASLSPRPTNRDRRGNDDGPGGSEERPEDRGGHEGRPVTQTTKQSMHRLLFSSPSRGNRVGPADAKIISAHHGKTDHEANPTDSPFCWSMAAQCSRCGNLVKSWSPSGCYARRGR